jgi:hypothetical protein
MMTPIPTSIIDCELPHCGFATPSDRNRITRVLSGTAFKNAFLVSPRRKKADR